MIPLHDSEHIYVLVYLFTKMNEKQTSSSSSTLKIEKKITFKLLNYKPSGRKRREKPPFGVAHVHYQIDIMLNSTMRRTNKPLIHLVSG